MVAFLRKEEARSAKCNSARGIAFPGRMDFRRIVLYVDFQGGFKTEAFGTTL